MVPLFPPNDDMQAFLRACKANPDDDAPRLVFADYLEENGHEARAQFIRLQCEQARLRAMQHNTRALDRELHSFAFQRETWLEPWRGALDRYGYANFTRGLVDLRLTAKHFSRLFCNGATQTAIFAWVERFTLLHLPGPHIRLALAALAQCTELVGLHLAGPRYARHADEQQLAWLDFPLSNFTSLRELELSEGVVSEIALLRCLLEQHWRNVRVLRLLGVVFDRATFELLAEPYCTPSLTHLEIAYPSLSADFEAVLTPRFTKVAQGRYVVKSP